MPSVDAFLWALGTFNCLLLEPIAFTFHCGLEHNLFKNVSKSPDFVTKTQIQTIEYGLIGLNDTVWMKKKQN